MQDYCTTKTCRRQVFFDLFTEPSAKSGFSACGNKCDNCQGTRKPTQKVPTAKPTFQKATTILEESVTNIDDNEDDVEWIDTSVPTTNKKRKPVNEAKITSTSAQSRTTVFSSDHPVIPPTANASMSRGQRNLVLTQSNSKIFKSPQSMQKKLKL